MWLHLQKKVLRPISVVFVLVISRLASNSVVVMSSILFVYAHGSSKKWNVQLAASLYSLIDSQNQPIDAFYSIKLKIDVVESKIWTAIISSLRDPLERLDQLQMVQIQLRRSKMVLELTILSPLILRRWSRVILVASLMTKKNASARLTRRHVLVIKLLTTKPIESYC